MFIPTFYVANYPDDCPQDVGCLPLAQKPPGVPAIPGGNPDLSVISPSLDVTEPARPRSQNNPVTGTTTPAPVSSSSRSTPAPTACKPGQAISPFTGECTTFPTYYVANYPRDCPQDVGCLPLSQKPPGVPATPGGSPDLSDIGPPLELPPPCRAGESVNPLTGQCVTKPTVKYVVNYPADCPQFDVALCLPISQKPPSVQANPNQGNNNNNVVRRVFAVRQF
jgi:hypothetical protein